MAKFSVPLTTERMPQDVLKRHPMDPDFERLLPQESQSDTDSIPYSWKGKPDAWAHRPQRKNSLSSAITPILIISNIITIAAVVVLLVSRPSSSPCSQPPVNHPPKGVAATLAHLVQQTEPRLWNYSFYDDGSWTRKHDSVEADQLWMDYTQVDGGFIMIPKEEAELADIDPARHAYIDRPDLGMVGYAVIPEALHQMHCVNTLRQSLYYNIEHTRKNCALPHCIPGEDAEEGNRLHIDHCLELIRLRIECTADLGIVPFMWYQKNGRLTGDVMRTHTCSNYEAVRKFVADNGVNPSDGALKWPEGQFYVEDFV